MRARNLTARRPPAQGANQQNNRNQQNNQQGNQPAQGGMTTGTMMMYAVGGLMVADALGMTNQQQSSDVRDVLNALDQATGGDANQDLLDLLNEYRDKATDLRGKLDGKGLTTVSYRNDNTLDGFLQNDVNMGYMPENSPRKFIQHLNDNRALDHASESREIYPLLHNDVINRLNQENMTGSGMCKCKRKCKCYMKGGVLGFRDQADEASHNFPRVVGGIIQDRAFRPERDDPNFIPDERIRELHKLHPRTLNQQANPVRRHQRISK
jgi:hypothetical protein